MLYTQVLSAPEYKGPQTTTSGRLMSLYQISICGGFNEYIAASINACLTILNKYMWSV